MKSISIARVSSNKEVVDYVSIVITTDTERIEVKLTLEEYAMLITGRLIADPEVDTRPLGK